MRQISRILCAVDFSEEARHALDHAVMLAKWYDAAITGVFVYAPLEAAVPAVDSHPVVPLTNLGPDDRRAFEQLVDSFLQPARDAGVATDVRLGFGRPSDGIVEAAAAAGADLIAMGTHGASGFQHLILGSVAEHVLRKAVCPVLTVPARVSEAATVPYERILCPVDFSECSDAAVELALSVASESDAEVQFLHVLEPGVDDEPRGSRTFSVPEYHREREAVATGKLDALIAGDAAKWSRPATRIGHGKPYREILRAAAEVQAGLIVMGVHGRNPFEVALFGSTTNQVVRRAVCPVLTVRP